MKIFASSHYVTMTKGDYKTLQVYASPRTNYYVSSYRWSFPGICINVVTGGSLHDNKCTVEAIASTKIATGNRVEVKCSWYQKEHGSVTETFGGDEYFYITVSEDKGSNVDESTIIDVISSTPQNGDVDVPVDVKPVLNFNKAISLNLDVPMIQRFRLEADDGTKIYINRTDVSNKILADGSSEGAMVLTPTKNLEASTCYTFVMPVGSVKTQDGAINSNEYHFEFTTKSITNDCSLVEFQMNPTNSNRQSKIYNSNGQLLQAPQKGLNIIRGKKYVSK